MAVISESPTVSIVVTQERMGTPSRCTVQAPHSAMPHPNFVPVMPNTSRKTQRSAVSPSTSTTYAFPLTLIPNAKAPPPLLRPAIGRPRNAIRLCEALRSGSVAVDLEHGLGKGVRGFLWQVVPYAALDR